MRLAFLLLIACALPAQAQDWPRQKPVHIVVGFPPGSTTDLVARLVQPKLAEALGQTVVIENKPGASGNVAAQQVKRAAPDGYTLFLTSVAYAVNPSLYANAGYDPFTDFIPVILAPSTPNLITVNPAVPAKNLQELIALARKERLSYASSGTGTTTHLSVERIKMAAKIDITHVPYQPAQAAGAAVGGHTQMSSTSMPPAVTHVRAGRLRAIAVTSAQRSPALPNVPSLKELGVKHADVDLEFWWGIFGPKGMPEAVKTKLEKAFQTVMADPKVRERLAKVDTSPSFTPGAPLKTKLENEIKNWTAFIDAKGIKAE